MSSKAISLALLFLCFWSRAFAAEVAGFIQPTADHPLKVKVVVLAMFENGADTGDAPGEYQFWVERRKMDYVIPLPAAFHDVRTDNLAVMPTVTGEGRAKARTWVRDLGHDLC